MNEMNGCVWFGIEWLNGCMNEWNDVMDWMEWMINGMNEWMWCVCVYE